MPRGYRCIFIALVGWLVLASASASAPNKSAPANQAQGNQAKSAPENAAAAPEPRYTAYPDLYAERCYQAKDHDSADLCAQWRAAYAAEKAANAARAGNWIAAGGAILSFASVVLVLMALAQGREANRLTREEGERSAERAVAGAADTKRALEIAAQNADATYAQASITERAVAEAAKTAEATAKLVELSARNSEAQLRAYLDFDGVSIKHEPARDKDGLVGICITVVVKNFGHTPATNVACRADYVATTSSGKVVFEGESSEETGSIAPTDHVRKRSWLGLPERQWRAILERQTSLSVDQLITYNDRFENPHTLKSVFVSDGEGDMGFVLGTRETD